MSMVSKEMQRAASIREPVPCIRGLHNGCRVHSQGHEHRSCNGTYGSCVEGYCWYARKQAFAQHACAHSCKEPADSHNARFRSKDG